MYNIFKCVICMYLFFLKLFVFKLKNVILKNYSLSVELKNYDVL